MKKIYEVVVFQSIPESVTITVEAAHQYEAFDLALEKAADSDEWAESGGETCPMVDTWKEIGDVS